MPDITVIQSVPFVFYGETFQAHLASDRQWYIPIGDVCQALGVEMSSQRQRILRDEAISDRLVSIPMDTPYQDATRRREVNCLNLRALPYWLGTLDAGRVREEHRRKVILFKREFAEAAWAVFRSDILPADVLAEMDASLPREERDYHEAMDQMSQVKRKFDLVTGRMEGEIERLGAVLADLTGRLGTLETSMLATLSPMAFTIVAGASTIVPIIVMMGKDSRGKP